MNNYGLVLNEIGLRPAFDALLAEVMLPMGARLFGSDEDRLSNLNGAAVGGENWGGSTLDDHHSFIVQYRPEDDKHLDMHIDECDVTFNFGITPSQNFKGNDLTFCGMFDADNHRKMSHTYQHQKGRCVVHSGKRRHGALDIKEGERASLIMWTKSLTFRHDMQYMFRNHKGLNYGPADRVCLSYTHDPDYKQLMPKKNQYHMAPEVEIDSISESTAPALTQKTWVRVCADAELKDEDSKMIEFKRENEQVVVYRHRGELFAIDNRCAHMGGPLCDGDVEDLGKHLARGARLIGDAKQTDGVVRCPRHGQCFNIRTGENIKGGHMRQRVFPVRLSGPDIEVEVPLEVDSVSDASEKDAASDQSKRAKPAEPLAKGKGKGGKA
jgi:nitrite reductase/ring-hydroxylating ferredoxin subunit